jgi:hypothetical protein
MMQRNACDAEMNNARGSGAALVRERAQKRDNDRSMRNKGQQNEQTNRWEEGKNEQRVRGKESEIVMD